MTPLNHAHPFPPKHQRHDDIQSPAKDLDLINRAVNRPHPTTTASPTSASKRPLPPSSQQHSTGGGGGDAASGELAHLQGRTQKRLRL